MTGCREFVLDDLMAITAIPVGNIQAGDPLSPSNCLAPVIRGEGFAPSLAGSVTIGQRPAVQDGALIPIMKNTGKAKDDESDGVAGRLHTVTVICEVDDRDGTVWNSLLLLERGAFHLLLTFRDGVTQAFVSATADTYLCNAERDGSRTTVTFRIQDLMGIQIIV